jgi:protein KRI1
MLFFASCPLTSLRDADIIKAYPRNVTTVRREENPRKAARERKRQRKEEKLQQKKEEINRLKALKLKDLRVKLDKIAHEGGKEIDDAGKLESIS